MKNKQTARLPVQNTKTLWNDVFEYGKYFSKKFLPKILQIELVRFFNKERYQLRKTIIKFLRGYPEKDNELMEIIQYLKKNPLKNLPYNFSNKYTKSIPVYSDTKLNMKYVIFDNKKLYFPRGWKNRHVSGFYRNILTEQDIDSPHRYEYDQFRVDEQDTVVDIGASEGLFSLSIVDRAKRLFIFECDAAWIEALTETFRPWKDKVEIISKYVTDIDDGKKITLDSYLQGQKINFIKADVEGSEIAVLSGAKKILASSKNLKIAICTYHRQNDYNDLKNILCAYGHKVEHSKGYVIHLDEKYLTAPYLRRGLRIPAHLNTDSGII
jgi:predicted RNA methylase